MTQTKVIAVDPRHIEPAVIKEAALILDKGGLVVFPTETVYGIAANLLHREAMERLKKIKERPQDKLFTIHICDREDVEKYAVSVSPRAHKLMSRFWPGPLTLVLAAAGEKSVGLRMPKNDIALRLLSEVDFPVVAPSANRAGAPAPRDVESVLRQLDGQVDLILDGGPTQMGRESTVVDARALPMKVLREGILSTDEISRVAARKTVLFVCTGNSCRSVMAEYLLKKKLADEGRSDVEVLSAGTFAFIGMSPTRETLKVLCEIGSDASAHRAQKATSELVRQFDLVLTMERRHQEELLRQFPHAARRIHLLGEFAGLFAPDAEFEDPIGKSEDFYRQCFRAIQKAVDRLGAKI